MTFRTALCRGAALGALLACVVAPAAANAATKHHHPKGRPAAPAATKSDIDELRAEVQSLEAWKSQQEANAQQTQSQVNQLQGQLAEANERAARAEQQLAEQIQTIPGAVSAEVAKHAPKTDKIYYKGITLTLGGFAAAEAVYRTRNNVADIGSNYSKIPYSNSVLAHTDELRGTARQSRVSFLAQGNINPNLVASFYGEFDFLAAPTTANENESNSFSPRIRHVYGALDWNDSGWHLLAGQNWSLATMNGKGISPRNEIIPPTIEAQYVPGFVWARQPQLRLTHDFDDKQVWLAISLENPQTTFASAATGIGTTLGGVTSNINNPGISLLSSVNSFSNNRFPDVIGKVAWEPIMNGAQPLHVEAFGILREYYSRVNIASGANQATAAGFTPGNSTQNTWGGGGGVGVTWTAVPKLLDVQGNFLGGKGIGRYGSGQLPDVIVGPGGDLKAIPEYMFMGGATLHATSQLDLYLFGGLEHQSSVVTDTKLGPAGPTVLLGYGNPQATLGNCFVELASCTPNTQQIDQVTVGFWDKVYTGSFGQVRVGIQYSHTDLYAFRGLQNAPSAPTNFAVQPKTSDDMVFTSFRYYPF